MTYYDDEPYDDDLADECDHEDYEVDILAGRATCNRCPHSWRQTAEEIESEIERIAEYDQWCQEQQRIEWPQERWWGRAWLAVKSVIAAAIRARGTK